MGNTSAENRGRNAKKPTQIPKKGWKDIASRVKDQLTKDHVTIISAGIAFYFFLAIFPTIAAALSIYGLLMEPAQVEQQMSQLANALPEQAHQMVSKILEQQSEKSGSSLGWSLVLSILISLWSANKGTKAVFEGVNITYNEKDERGFIKLNALTLLFTICGIIIGFLAIAMIVVFPAVIDMIGLPSTLETIVQLVRWPILALIVISALAVVYKVAPYRESPEFKWTSWGAIIATVLWLAGSLLFTLYVKNFGSFDATYGSFAAVIILMLWFYLTAFVILLGAEINSEMEHQTSRDTTTGEDKPMGQRGGYHADHVAGEDRGDDKRR
ncbi:YihY/virulence factor BrkB family protein [Cesiribacter sp. SM1]|uniref:YihY/virulence factor BrkB family protein n=1 Tax=Cesiribacter sp. SM1 TaxID=2861196 RepID=UPI001CD4779A|nr:YihY/virulence factor BrkB family protein [Cesiribacter sp. SM1]